MDDPVLMDFPAEDHQSASWARTLMEHRRTVLPKRLHAPGPSAAQLEAILGAAASAPDHGGLVPWRFFIVPEASRPALGKAFADALRERDPLATAAQAAEAAEKARRSPLLMLVVVQLGDCGDAVPRMERVLAAGCAVQNMLLMATALGYASALTSGKAMRSHALRRLFDLSADEQAVCFMNIGTAASRKAPRARPLPARYVRVLGE